METEANDYRPRHLADRQELSDHVPGQVRFNPWAKCTGSAGGHHVKPCPMHHPASYSKMAPRRWRHRQAVSA